MILQKVSACRWLLWKIEADEVARKPRSAVVADQGGFSYLMDDGTKISLSERRLDKATAEVAAIVRAPVYRFKNGRPTTYEFETLRGTFHYFEGLTRKDAERAFEAETGLAAVGVRRID